MRPVLERISLFFPFRSGVTDSFFTRRACRLSSVLCLARGKLTLWRTNEQRGERKQRKKSPEAPCNFLPDSLGKGESPGPSVRTSSPFPHATPLIPFPFVRSPPPPLLHFPQYYFPLPRSIGGGGATSGHVSIPSAASFFVKESAEKRRERPF